MERETALVALRIAGYANILIGIGHVLSMPWMRETLEWVGGPDFDRLHGLHPTLPYLATLGAALAFVTFGLYALSAAGDLPRLPLTNLAILGIMWIYFVRAIGGAGIGGYIEDESLRDVVFSSVAFVLAILYAIGARTLMGAGDGVRIPPLGT